MQKLRPSPRPAINRTGRKFDQVLEGARMVFMADGFEAANVDKIARAANVSKATLYSYFPDKACLFTEVARCECERMADDALESIDLGGPVREVLIAAGMRIATFLLSDFAQQMFRVCVSERDRFPEIARAFYRSGPEMGRRRLEEVLALAVTRGELAIDNPGHAAEQFSDLAKSRLWLRAILGVQERFSDAEIREVTEEAVETFLARYAAPAG